MPPILLAVDKIYPRSLMWFRHDLRVKDNAALFRALRQCRQVFCVFVFERAACAGPPRADRRVEFQRESLVELDVHLRTLGGGLIVRHAAAQEEIPALARQLGVQAVYANRVGDPLSHAADTRLFGALAAAGVMLHTSKDRVIFEHDEVLSRSGAALTAFGPYRRAWLDKLNDFYLKPYPSARYADALAMPPPELAHPVPALEELGFERSNLSTLNLPPGARGGAAMFEEFFSRIDHYAQARHFPSVRGPSYLSAHLRLGTVSVRQLAGAARRLALQGHVGANVWLGELIRREFFFQIFIRHPQLAQGKSFQPAYDHIIWHHGKHADTLFAAWCEGRTGYPLVDAAMAQINSSGYMHNRLRMVAASFLCKTLGLDWRRGEAYFARHLTDYEPASNNGNWQWISSSGCDAQPYVRILNPVMQSQRFDPEGKFIRRYLPQLAKLPNSAIHAPWTATPQELESAGVRLGGNYPAPIVDHAQARERTLARYAVCHPRRSTLR